MSSNKEINSFAVFDLETTGLPSHNFNKANITELTIHGFPAENVRSSTSVGNRRVNHSLTLQFNPRMRISPKAEEITGLNNYILEKESFFDENAAGIIINFLKHLRQPVCLVAHNGEKFDFPILKEAFQKLNVELPSDILCLDSYEAFVSLDEKCRAALAKKEISIACETPFEDEDFKLNTLPFLNDDDTPSTIVDLTTPKKHPEQSDNEVEAQEKENTAEQIKKDEEKINTNWQKINETTPKQGIKISQLVTKKQKVDTKDSNKIPNRRRLEFTTPLRSPGFYKLVNIYTRLFAKEPEVTHQAEADVILLKEIIFKYGDSFVDWAEENAKAFGSIKSLRGR